MTDRGNPPSAFTRAPHMCTATNRDSRWLLRIVVSTGTVLNTIRPGRGADRLVEPR